ncbi:hypothetical protein DV738_g2335, partial [Chaetothyriales sp. CBS 135597]
MWIFMIIALLGPLLATQSTAAFLPVRQVVSGSQCTPSTVYSYITITRSPPTVTIANYNPAALSSQAASDASIDTAYEIEQSQLRPVSASAPTTLAVHTHVLTAPAFPATEAADGVYWFESRPITRWGIIPTGDNWPVGTTLVTVYPLSARTSGSQTQQPSVTSTLTRTVSPLPASASGTVVSAATGVSPSPPYGFANTSSLAESSILTLSTTEYPSTVTVDIVVTETATAVWRSLPPIDLADEMAVTATANQPTITDRIAPRQTSTPGVTASGSPSTTSSTAIGTTVSNTSSTTPVPTFCGEYGPFEISFDYLPVPSFPDNATELHPPLELRSAFLNHFVWAIDWTYGPPPNEPYMPHDPPFLGWYIPELNGIGIDSPSHNTGSIPPGGSFGAGPRNDNSSFWFNADSGYAACDNVNSDPNHTCDFVATGYQFTGEGDEVVATQHFTIAPCPSNATASCSLEYIKFSSQFTKLSALSFYANVQGQLRPLYLDSLVLNWWDNNCTAGLERQGSP